MSLLKLPKIDFSKRNRFTKSGLTTLCFFVLIAVIVIVPFSVYAKIGIVVIAAILFVYLRRGMISFMHGAKLLQLNGPNPYVYEAFEKALKYGVSLDYKVSIGTIFIQTGKIDRGIEILREVCSDNIQKQEVKNAMISLSMALSAEGKTDEAIDLLENLVAFGYMDNNLRGNLITYYLFKGRVEDAQDLIDTADDRFREYPATQDSLGCCRIVRGEWDEAQEVFDDLVEREVDFPDAYIHAAQVYVHLGDYEKACKLLDSAVELNFPCLGDFSRDYVLDLREGLKTKGEEYGNMMDKNALLIISGQSFGE